MGFKNLIKMKLEKVSQLSHKIMEDIQDTAKYEEEMETVIEVKLF